MRLTDAMARGQDAVTRGRAGVATLGRDAAAGGQDAVTRGRDAAAAGRDAVARGQDAVARDPDAARAAQRGDAVADDATAGSQGAGTAGDGKGRGRRAEAPQSPRRVLGSLAFLEVVLVAMAAATINLYYGHFFATRGYLLPLMVAAAGGAAVAALTTLWRWRSLATTVMALLGFMILVGATVLTGTYQHGMPTGRTASVLADGLLRGWSRMLAVNLPADADPDLLLTPTLLTWIAALTASVIVLRTRAVVAPAAPPLLSFLAALLVTAPRAGTNPAVTTAFLLEILLMVAVRGVRLEVAGTVVPQATSGGGQSLRGQSVRGRGVARRVAGTVPIILVVAAVGVVAARYVPIADGSSRYDPRGSISLQYHVDDTLTPLATIKSQLRQTPAQPVMSVRVDRSAGVTLSRVRTAALDTYDGALWTSSDHFLVAGHTFTGDSVISSPREVGVHVSIDDLAGPYLPTVGWPVRVSAGGLGYSTSSGVLVSRAASLNRLSYDLTAEVRPSDDGIAKATPGVPAGDVSYTQLAPGLPMEIRQRAVALSATAPTPYGKLVAIEKYLHNLPYSLDARPGHSYDALRRLFSANAVDRVGYAEQYAAAFVVLARSLGIPCRVAVGYLLRVDSRSGDTYRVTTADAHAWPEAYLIGYGWVSFEPTDFTRTQTAKQTQQQQTQAGSSGNQTAAPNPASQPVIDPSLRRSGPGTGARILEGSLIAAAVLGGLALLVPFLIVGAKYRRRLRRRRRGSRASQVIGAWQELTDRLVERGIEVSQSLTPLEVALRAEQELGDCVAAAGLLAPIVTEAMCSPTEQQEQAVRDAWNLYARLRRDLRRGRGVLRAARAVFDPRPFTHGWQDDHRRRRKLRRMRAG